MEIVHGTWVPHKRKFCIWHEKETRTYAPSLEGGTKDTLSIVLPTHNKRALPSLSMARNLDVEYPDNLIWEKHTIPCISFDPAHFKNLEISENEKLAPDLLFWKNMCIRLEEILEKNLYVPGIDHNKESVWITHHPEIDKLAEYMPELCCYVDNEIYEKKDLLKNFFDYMVNHIANKIFPSTAFEKSIDGTFMNKYVSHRLYEPCNAEEIKNWHVWSAALRKNRHDICFHLDAPGHSSKEWTMRILRQDPRDPSKKESIGTDWKKHLADLGLALRIYPEFEHAFLNKRIEDFTLTKEEAVQFLKETSWVLQSAGFPVIIPSWYTPKGHNIAKLKMKRKPSKSKSSQGEAGYFSVGGVLDFDYTLSLNGEEVSPEEWQRLINNKEELIQFRGKWVQLDLDNMQKIMDFWQKTPSEDIDLFTLMDRASHPDIELDESTDSFMMSLYGKQNFNIFDEPKGFNGQLRDYQKSGYSWMKYLEKLGLNPCLADDMGLGKTVQIIALMLSDQEKEFPNLLVVPTSVLGNWERELKRFAPSLTRFTYHAQSKSTELENVDVVLTTYTMVRKDHKIFKNKKWYRVILDEAQNIKNPKVAQTKAVSSLKSEHYLALTGTPIENSLLDLWSIFNFLNTNYLGTSAQFKKKFHRVPENRAQLKRLTEPFILRRLKTDKTILSELPDKIEQNVYCKLTKEQATLYQGALNKMKDDFQDEELSSSTMLATLTRLKQICNHPAQYLQDNSDFSPDRSYKLERLEEIVEEAIENEESILIFSQYKEICELLNKRLSQKYNTYLLHGSTTRSNRDQMVEEFQDEKTPPSVFILSLKAGGVGITLTKASQVIHFDRWWNPAIEKQATDRAYRIGQNKKVMVHKFVVEGTLEETIDLMLKDKAKLSESILSDDSSWLKDLDTSKFMELVKLRKEALSD